MPTLSEVIACTAPVDLAQAFRQSMPGVWRVRAYGSKKNFGERGAKPPIDSVLFSRAPQPGISGAKIRLVYSAGIPLIELLRAEGMVYTAIVGIQRAALEWAHGMHLSFQCFPDVGAVTIQRVNGETYFWPVPALVTKNRYLDDLL